MSGSLGVADRLDIPLREVSGLCTSPHPDGGAAIVAIGDASSQIAVARFTAQGLGAWETVDLADGADDALPRTDTQAEAIASDGTGRLVVLLEEPARVVVFGPDGELLADVALVVPPDQAVAEAWQRDPNSRGEGLVLLAGGRLLVVKEKDPPALIEFGPAAGPPLGFAADRLVGPDDEWTPPRHEVGADPPTLEARATWLLDRDLADDLGDVSDAAVGPDGRLYVLSDQSSRLVRLAPSPAPGSGWYEAEETWRIEGKPDKAEGLDFLPDGRALVALDTRKAKHNLLLLEPAVAAP